MTVAWVADQEDRDLPPLTPRSVNATVIDVLVVALWIAGCIVATSPFWK